LEFFTLNGAFYFWCIFKCLDAITPGEKSSINNNRKAEGRGNEDGYGAVSTYPASRGVPLPPLLVDLIEHIG